MRFDAYPQRQFVTESININSLADHHIWSTIKTLPATLPEPSSVVRGPSFEDQGPSFTDHGPVATDHGPGLLGRFLIRFGLDCGGWGLVWVGGCYFDLGA
jgi:hypothetical protein